MLPSSLAVFDAQFKKFALRIQLLVDLEVNALTWLGAYVNVAALQNIPCAAVM